MSTERLLAPEPIVYAALRVLFICAYSTRNWTIDGGQEHRKIYWLWEAVHEIPDLLSRWKENSEVELLSYLDEFDAHFPGELNLRREFELARSSAEKRLQGRQ